MNALSSTITNITRANGPTTRPAAASAPAGFDGPRVPTESVVLGGAPTSAEANWQEQLQKMQQLNARRNQQHQMAAEFAASRAEANNAPVANGGGGIAQKMQEAQMWNSLRNQQHLMAAEIAASRADANKAPVGNGGDAMAQKMQEAQMWNSLRNQQHLMAAQLAGSF